MADTAGAPGSPPSVGRGPEGPASARHDRVLLATRVLAVTFVALLLPAFVVLSLWPSADDTERLFTWRITPPFTAMFLASVYLGGIFYFLRAATAKEWHRVGTGFIAVACFAALMGTATLLHWDRFVHTNLAFWIWAPLYWITPFWLIAVWVVNRREDPGPPPGEPLLPPRVAVVMAGVGLVAAATGLLLFVLPGIAITIWPWMLTELTARIVGACFVLGLAGAMAFRDRRWSSYRILLQAEGVMLTAMAVAALRAPTDFAASRPLTWMFSVGFVAVAVASAALYVRMERLPRR